MAPQDTSVGLPRPRKVSVVSDKIADATVRLIDTRISGVTFGSTCLTSTWRLVAPSAWARSTNGRASTASDWARTSRAVGDHEVIAIAVVIEASPWPRTAAR